MRLNTASCAMLTLLLAGCATSSAVNQSNDPVMLMLGNGSAIRYNRDVRVITAPVPGTPVAMWPALNAAYANLKLAVTQRDSSQHVLAAQNAQFNGRFAGAALSRVIDCGLTPYGAERANSYRVWLTVVSQLQPSATGSSILRTSIAAKAQDPNSSGPTLQCGSTGVIEADIARALGGDTSN